MSTSGTTRRISSTEWANRKSRILELYFDHEHTLLEVIDELKRDGFVATKSQYEHQLRVWGIRKNMKRDEWAKAIQERQQGIPITLSGRAVSNSKIETARRRYAPRKPHVPKEPVPRINGDVARETMTPLITPETTTTATGFHNEAFSLPIHTVASHIDLDQDQDMLLFESTSAPTDTPFHQNYEEFELSMINADLMNPDNLILPERENSLALEAYLPINNDSFSIESLLVDYLSRQFMDIKELSAQEWVSFPNPHTSTYPSPLGPHNGNGTIWPVIQWSSPLPTSRITSMIIKDIYSNGVTGPNQNIVWKFFADMGRSTFRETTAIPATLKSFFSNRDLVGEERTQLAMLPNNVLREGRLYTRLVASVINGFANLGHVSAGDVLTFLNDHPTIQLSMIEFVRSDSGPVARSLAENIFQAALEADDVDIVEFLLDHTDFFDINETVCYYEGVRYTPLGKASDCESFDVIKFLIARKVDIDRPISRYNCSTALSHLIKHRYIYRSIYPDDFLSTIDTLLEASARISIFDIELALERCTEFALERCTDLRLLTSLVKGFVSRAPEQFTSQLSDHTHRLFRSITHYLTKQDAVSVLGLIIQICQELGHEVDAILDFARQEGLEEILVQYLPSYSGKIHQIHETEEQMGPIKHLIAALKSRDQGDLCSLGENDKLSCLTQDELGQVFTVALEEGNLEFATNLLNLDPDLSTNCSLFHVAPAIKAALSHNFDDIAWELLASFITTYGRNITFASNWVTQVLHAAVANARLDFVEAIAEFGCSHHLACIDICKEETINEIISILEAAIQWGDKSAINNVWKAYINFPSLTDKLCCTVLKTGRADLFWDTIGSSRFGSVDENQILRRAVFESQYHPMITTLMERYKKLYPQGLDEYGRDAINGAIDIYTEFPEILDTFLDFGLVTVNILLGDGVHRTPLVHAIKWFPPKYFLRNKSRLPAIERLLNAGSDVNSTVWDELGMAKTTAFLEAIEMEDMMSVELIIQYGADINKPACFGLIRTPLQKAAEQNNIDIVRLLLDKGAEVNAAAAMVFGATALQYAAIQGNCEMVKLLIEHGARLDVPPSRGKDGRWPIEGAAENGRLDMIQLLWNLNGGTFGEKQCRRAMQLAERNGFLGCRDFIKELMSNGSSNDMPGLA